MQTSLLKLSQQYSDIKWNFVYVREAHAMDEWPISSSRSSDEIINIKSHSNIEERIQAAKYLLTKFPLQAMDWNILVAPMDNIFENEYKCWPIGMFVFENDRLSFASEPDNANFDLLEFQKYLE